MDNGRRKLTHFFSRPMEFLIGNVGRDAGTLTFKGKFEAPDLITGEVEFSPLVGDRPSKLGTFKAVRASGWASGATRESRESTRIIHQTAEPQWLPTR